MFGIKVPSSLSEKIGPFPFWAYLLGIGVLAVTKRHWGVGAISGGGIQGVGGGIVGGGIGGYGGEGYSCNDEGYCGDQGGGGGGKHKRGGGGPGGGMGWY